MGVADLTSTCPGQPTETEVRQQLDRIFASPEFHSPQRGRAFLQFIVNETLAGHSEFLKAFTIANVVFGRNVSFDAQNDPVVRIEAGRMRRALERYYLVGGNADRVVVTIPKGGYVPSFDYADGYKTTGTQPASAPISAIGIEPTDHYPSPDDLGNHSRAWAGYALPAGAALLVLAAFGYIPLNPSRLPEASLPAETTNAIPPQIFVEQFDNIVTSEGAPDIADGLRDEVIGQLAKFKGIVVIANLPTTKRQDLSVEPRYALQGSARLEGNTFRSLIRLVRRADGAVLWANNYDGDVRSQGVFQIQEDIAERIASTLAQPHGTMFLLDAGGLANQPANRKCSGYV
ncbi:hypothetical protein [Rhizobium sp. Root1220]|uniref:hypothetical protein n=1 Tax=Rhizobium sp. Root1220 TaxID=1736432 RepID=UPI0006F437FC|nr:hypothetical protein [Rhizobium sp. Root1220]KQV64405.1 hypothetical protein ASC90_16040 [Rhizobium sp. Root1220]